MRARFTMVIPVLRGMLFSTKRDMVQALGGIEKISLEQFARIYVESPGDYGICFEYAVHQALQKRDPAVHPLVSQVLNDFCRIKEEAESILFGAEKTGATSIIETCEEPPHGRLPHPRREGRSPAEAQAVPERPGEGLLDREASGAPPALDPRPLEGRPLRG
jgi:hypothetical protein